MLCKFNERRCLIIPFQASLFLHARFYAAIEIFNWQMRGRVHNPLTVSGVGGVRAEAAVRRLAVLCGILITSSGRKRETLMKLKSPSNGIIIKLSCYTSTKRQRLNTAGFCDLLRNERQST